MGNGSLVFFGTAAIALPFLHTLKGHYEIGLIITQPDAPSGRSRKPVPPAVKTFALDEGIPCIQPGRLRDPEVAERIGAVSPRIGVVIAYGKIIPKSIYTLPEHRTVNVHFSLLPAYRGAAPVQRAIENGDTSTGITIFEIDRRMDHGDIWARREYPLSPSETSGDALERLSREGAPFLLDTLEKILGGRIDKIPQDHDRATLAAAISKEEGRVDWSEPAPALLNRLRAFTPWPGLYFYAGEKMFKIRSMEVATGAAAHIPSGTVPGAILGLDRDGLRVACGAGTVALIRAFQPQGKRTMSPFDYALGNPLPDQLN